MMQIGSLRTEGKIFVIFHDEKAKVNPYRIYEKYWNRGWHKKQLERYGNLASCTAYIHGYVMDHDEE